MSELEAGQLVAQTAVPVDRATLSTRVRAGLWALRIFTVALAAVVTCAFVLTLG